MIESELNTACSYCGDEHDRNLGIKEKAIDGDLSICIECGEVSIFDSTSPTGTRQPTAEEKHRMEFDMGIILMKALVKEAQRDNG